MTAARPMRRERRQPGVRFEVRPPPLPETLPRMDVACFCGFAASGPLHMPVVVEDPAHFESIFGGDAPLAWDRTRGARIYAYLAPTVRAFFRNGGRRCWVIRVAGVGATNVFPIAGLWRVDGAGDFVPATAVARSQGSWSDALRLASALVSKPLLARTLPTDPSVPLVVDLDTRSQDDVDVGDLVRITFDGGGADPRVVLFVVDRFEAMRTTAGDAWLRVYGRDGRWFRTLPTGLVAGVAGTALLDGQSFTATFVSATAIDESYVFDLATTLSAAFVPGAMVQIDLPVGRLWMTLSDAVTEESVTSPPSGSRVRVTGAGLFASPLPTAPLSTKGTIERLRFELEARASEGDAAVVGDLGFDGAHPRPFWALPSDEELYRATDDEAAIDGRAAEMRDRHDDLAPLWSDASEPRFAIAAGDGPSVSFLPIGMPFSLDFPLAAIPNATPALARDGLGTFDASLFLDPSLADVDARGLIAEADFIRYQSPTPQRLRGIHAALAVDEATLIAAPDAVLAGWTKHVPSEPPSGAPAEPPAANPAGTFVDCNLHALDTPVPKVPDPVDARGSFTVTWTPIAGAVAYEIEESADPMLVRGVVTYRTTANALAIYGHAPGVVYLRARAIAQVGAGDATDSGWSAAIVVKVLVVDDYEAADDAAGAPVLLDVQRALLRMCAARGDLFALLGLPPSPGAAFPAAHVSALRALEAGSSLSYGATYHPWTIARDTYAGPLRAMPPEGTIAGLYARRALTRGAWVAPANEPLDAVVGLGPRLDDDAWAVLDDQPVNRLRVEPHGFVTMRADTLSDDDDYAPVNVRRLLILLRRAAIKLGATYAFEPNGPVLARTVEGAFTSMLDQLFQRGAFKGARAEEAYQVVTDDTVNTPGDADRGRFIVEIKVAPARPLEFLTVRLVQSGDRVDVAEVR